MSETQSNAPKTNKVMVKRAQIYQERKKRLLAKGIAPEKVDRVIAEEDYRNMPVAQKLERFIMSMNQAFQLLGQDIQALQHNDTALADSMDLNFRAMALCLEKAGVSKEEQSKYIKQASDEIKAELEARKAAESKKAEEAKAATEASLAEQELQKAEKAVIGSEDDAGTEPIPVPDGATTFGE